MVFVSNSSAQIVVTPGNVQPFTPENLISNIFLGDGVDVLSIVHEGNGDAVGFFQNGMSDIGIERGIIMSSGFAATAATPNNDPGTSGNTSGTSVGDDDLAAATTVDLMDVVKYTITFIPVNDTLRFTYAFASEEYPEFTCSDFNDVFGFFITGPNPSGPDYMAENIAIVPGTNQTVAINNVHDGNPNDAMCTPINNQFYNDNSGSITMTYDAYLDVFVAEAIVVPCQEYTIKLAIADGQDADYDSAVFLEAKSFGTGALSIATNTVSLDGALAEGCADGEIVFKLGDVTAEDFEIDFILLDDPSLPSQATEGQDYPDFPDQLIIPAGSDSLIVNIEAFDDSFVEGEEFIYLDFQRNVCGRDTLRIPIRDNILQSPVFNVTDTTTICQGDEVFIDSELAPGVEIPEAPFFQNSTDLILENANEGYFSDIEVSNVIPDLLSPDVLKRVCIDSLEHRWLNDLDMFLITPGGQFLELSTDNGEDGGNGIQQDSLINMCFTVESTTPVNNGNPVAGPLYVGNETYTGEFEPEGVWSDLWDGSYPTNGTWSLLIIDDVDDSLIPVLQSWSICFESIYDISYSWSPNTNINCLDCPDVTVQPDNSTMYYLTSTDTYGCQVVDSLFIEVEEPLPAPENVLCDSVDVDAIKITWEQMPEATGYEIRINGMDPWINVGTDLEYVLNGLDPDTDYSFEIRALDAMCDADMAQISCRTLDCTPPDVDIVSQVAPSCFGGSDGSLILEASNSVGPYSYTIGSETNDDGVFNNLESGSYMATVRDALDCEISFNVEVPSANEILTEAFPVNPSCFEGFDGEVSFAVSNGVAPYTFEWSNSQNDSLLTNLEAGQYIVTITDAQLCEKIDTIDLIDPTAIDIDISKMDVDCFGESSGSATAMATGGTGVLTYLWNDPMGQSTSMANNLTVGNYSVTVTDENMCTAESSVEILEPELLTVEATGSTLVCFNTATGSALAIAQGGTEDYTFNWNFQMLQGPMISDLLPGSYIVTVTDANFCTAIDTAFVESPAPIDLDIDMVEPSCFGDADGSITVTPSGGTGNFTFLWANGEQQNSLSDLMAGEYCLTIADVNDCELDTCIQLMQVDAFEDNAVIEDAQCSSSATGSIDISLTGGTEPISYAWTGPNAFTAVTEDISNLLVGDYVLIVTDDNDCTAEFNYTIDEPNPIEINAIVANVNCFEGDDGSIQLIISGGNEPYQISWTGPNNFSSDQSTIENLVTGNYQLNLVDDAGCIVTRNFEVLQPLQPLTLVMSIPDTLCAGQNSGTASVVASGGAGIYNYKWSTGGETNTEINLSDGVVTVTVTDVNGCEEIGSTEIVELGPISLDIDVSFASCFGASDATAEVNNIFYGNDLANINDFSFFWNSIPPQFDATAENLIGGENYVLVVEDKFGCSATQEISIQQPEEVQVILESISEIKCNSGEDGEILVSAEGGSQPYEFDWSPNTNFQTGPLASNLSAGEYSVTVTDNEGCTSSAEFELTDPIAINLDFRVFDVLCFGESSGELEAIVSGGTTPYTFEWSNGQSGDEIIDLEAGTYALSLSDSNGCTIVDSVMLQEPAEPVSLDVEAVHARCFDSRSGSIVVNGFGGSGQYSYSIDGFNFNGNHVIGGLRAGEYTVYVKDFKGCLDSLNGIIIEEPDPIEIDLGPDITVSWDESVQLFADVINAQGPVSFEWSSFFLDSLDCIDCQDPIVNGIREAMTFKVNVVDTSYCMASDIINIFVELNENIFVPTGFTPNGDGSNDLLYVFGTQEATIGVFRVYTRWGELVYENSNFPTNDESIGWDGTFKNQELMPGVYVWTAEAIFPSGNVVIFNGETTLIR